MIKSTFKVLIFTFLLNEMNCLKFNKENAELNSATTCANNYVHNPKTRDMGNYPETINRDSTSKTQNVNKDQKNEDTGKIIESQCQNMKVNCCSKNDFDNYNETQLSIGKNFYAIFKFIMHMGLDYSINANDYYPDLISKDHNIVPSDCLKENISKLLNENKYSFDTITKEIKDYINSYVEVRDRLYGDHICFLCDSRYSLVLEEGKKKPSSLKEYLAEQSIDDYFELLRKSYKIKLNFHLLRLLIMPSFCKYDLGNNHYDSSSDDKSIIPFDEEKYYETIAFGKQLEECRKLKIGLDLKEECKDILSDILDTGDTVFKSFENEINNIVENLYKIQDILIKKKREKKKEQEKKDEDKQEDEEEDNQEDEDEDKQADEENEIEDDEQEYEDEDSPSRVTETDNSEHKSYKVQIFFGSAILVIAMFGVGFYLIRKE